jgi:hypothetical protein
MAHRPGQRVVFGDVDQQRAHRHKQMVRPKPMVRSSTYRENGRQTPDPMLLEATPRLP